MKAKNLKIFKLPLSEIEKFLRFYDDIPNDAKAVRIFTEQRPTRHGYDNILHIVMEHDTFDEVPEGYEIPYSTILIE